MDTRADETLLGAARDGDAEALDALLVRHQDRVYRFAMRACRQREDAEDVLQDTLLAAARSIGGFRGASSFSTWLYTIAHRACARKRRRGRSVSETGSLDDATSARDPGAGPEASLTRREVTDALEAAIAALEPKYREVLLLRDAEGLTAPEVAEVLGLGVPAVKTRLHRARKAVREAVSARMGIEPSGAATTCPDVVDLYSRKLEGEISQDLCRDMERHLVGCPRCRDLCDSLRDTLALCRAAPPHVPLRVQAAVRAALREFLQRR